MRWKYFLTMFSAKEAEDTQNGPFWTLNVIIDSTAILPCSLAPQQTTSS